MRNPLVVGDRLYLRPLDRDDIESMVRDSANEPETFMERGRLPLAPLDLEKWIDELYEQPFPSEIQLAVCLKENDRCIGFVGLEEVDFINRSGETGAWLTAADYRGQGYGTEAKHLLLEYCFDRLHLHVLCSTIWEPNTRSAAAVQKQGYRLAGRWKWADVKDGVYRDVLFFDVMRDEWLEAREKWRASLSRP